MKLTAGDVIDAMGGISQQLIMEAASGSPRIREGIIVRISTAAASLALVAAAGIFTLMYAGGGHITPPANTSPLTETETETDNTEVRVRMTTTSLDDTEIKIMWAEDADGGIVHADVTATGDHTVKFADTQWKYYEKMLLFVDDAFYVECDLKTGRIRDFMRINEAVDGAVLLYWRYDDYPDAYMIALVVPLENCFDRVWREHIWEIPEYEYNGTLYTGPGQLIGLWAYDYGTATLSVAEAPTPDCNIVLLPKEGTDPYARGAYALIWALNGDEENGGVSFVCEASEFFPDVRYHAASFRVDDITIVDETNRIVDIVLQYCGQILRHEVYLKEGYLRIIWGDTPYVTDLTVDGSEIEVGFATNDCCEIREIFYATAKDGRTVEIAEEWWRSRRVTLVIDGDLRVECDLWTGELIQAPEDAVGHESE